MAPQNRSFRRSSSVTYVSPESAACVVSRQSGLKSHVGTFGKNTRFAENKLMSDHGAHSPWGLGYFAQARFSREGMEIGKQASLGVGSRPQYVRGLPNVGPGTYSPCTSVAKPASSLDGKKYCKVTMKIRPRITVGAVSPHEEALKPGPGTYTLRNEINGEYVKRGLKANWSGPPSCKIGLPLRVVPDAQGDALYDLSTELGDKRMPFNDLQKASTFGFFRRWEDEKSMAKTSQSPDGEMYYSHVKLVDDYQKVGKACSLGAGERPDLQPSQHTASPASYFPITSVGKITSSLDGFTVRNVSPVRQFAGVSSLKRRSMSQPPKHNQTV